MTRLQGEQLPLAHAAPVERLEGVEGERLVHDLVREPEVLVLGPEPHLAGGLRPHGLGPAARVRREAVEAHGVVEERAELVVDGLEVGRGEPAPARLLEGHQLVLPPHDVDRGDLVHALLAQVGEDALRDDGLLGLPGVQAQARPHVLLVELEEVDELHVHVARLHGVEVALPRERLGLGLEAPLHLVGALAVVGLVPGLDVPGAVPLIPCHRHRNPPRPRTGASRSTRG